MQFEPMWIGFFVVLFLMGSAAAGFHRMVLRILRRGLPAPQQRSVLVFRILGVFVAIVSMLELISIAVRGRML